MFQIGVDSDGNVGLYGMNDWRILANNYSLIVSWTA